MNLSPKAHGTHPFLVHRSSSPRCIGNRPHSLAGFARGHFSSATVLARLFLDSLHHFDRCSCVSRPSPFPSLSSVIPSRRTFFRITAERTVVMVSAVDPVRMAVPTSKDPAVVATYKNSGRMSRWTSRLASGSIEFRSRVCVPIPQSRISDGTRIRSGTSPIDICGESYRSRRGNIAMKDRYFREWWRWLRTGRLSLRSRKG